MPQYVRHENPLIRILGIDPGLVNTGWGVIESAGSEMRFVASGVVKPKTTLVLPERLKILHDEITKVIGRYRPQEAAIEETFITANGASTLKLGQARGALLLTLSLHGLPVAEYAARLVKKTVVGTGSAEKSQVQMMVKRLLPLSTAASADAADAMAIALCHAQHRTMSHHLQRAQ